MVSQNYAKFVGEKRWDLALTILMGVCSLQSLVDEAFGAEPRREPLFKETIDVNVPKIATDARVKYDYDIVYVRAQRAGDKIHKRFYTDFSQPVTMQPGADLMLLHPDGSEDLLVEGGNGSITDPIVSFDAKWVYYTQIYNLEKASPWNPPREGADIFKINLETRRIVQLTNQQYVPNTGAADWSDDYRNRKDHKHHLNTGVYNMGPHPLPGGKLVFTSNRHGFRPSKGYPAIALQLFVMDDSDESVAKDDRYPNNIEKIGHLNIAGALHPVVLKDGRIMFSSLESQGIRSSISWGIWTIHPDGTNWGPLISAFDPGGAANGFHFQTQLSDGSLIIEQYYNQNNSGFGAYIKMPPKSSFGPAYRRDPRNEPWRFGRHYNGKGRWYRKAFLPTGSVSFTPFTRNGEGPADPSVLAEKSSAKVGKFTHPSGAPNNHLLTVYSPGPANHQYTELPQIDGGIYLIKDGKIVEEPADMLLIKNDPKYNESWPRAVVSYERIYGVKEPQDLARLANDGSVSAHLPQGTPFGLVGTSSLYKRDSYPDGVVPEGKVTSTYPGGNDPWKGLDAFTSHGNGMPINFHNQGGDVGLYENSEIHAIRILAMEPTTAGHPGGRRFYSHASERLRIMGEIPVRKFTGKKQLNDPDGNPDTSFLAKIPADTAFTFQTIDKNGLMLNASQTWHQLRPGEKRVDCGGCHAHSQKPTLFESTLASRKGYKVWDLVNRTPLVTDKKSDESKQQWDDRQETGLKNQDSIYSVEYYRDIRPILQRSCVACHSKGSKEPAGNLVLDDMDEIQYKHNGKFPGDYYRLALDEKAQFGHKPIGYDSYGYPNASRYVRQMQARRSLLVWKIFGKRLDGFSNDDHPSESKPGSRVLAQKGELVDMKKYRAKWDLDFVGSQMPPADAVKKGKVKALSDEDRRTIVRWIDLGSPIDLDFNPEDPGGRGYGWMCDDNRPILTLNQPREGINKRLDRILIGMHDYYTGLDVDALKVVANFAIGDIPPGTNLAKDFKETPQGIWELKIRAPIEAIEQAVLTVSIKDMQGNHRQIVRKFSIEP